MGKDLRKDLRKDLGEQRLVALFACGCLLFNFPLLALWDRDVTLIGVPLFPAALFLIWAVLIVVLRWIVEHCDDAGEAQAPPSSPAPDRGAMSTR